VLPSYEVTLALLWLINRHAYPLSSLLCKGIPELLCKGISGLLDLEVGSMSGPRHAYPMLVGAASWWRKPNDPSNFSDSGAENVTLFSCPLLRTTQALRS